MNVIKDVEIKEYKGIEEINFPCNSINIIVGPNNTGKSSILESIWLTIASLNDFKDILDTGFNHVIGREDNFKYLIHGSKKESQIKLKVSENDNVELSLKYCEKDCPEELREIFHNFLFSLNEYDYSPYGYEAFGPRDTEYRLYRELQRVSRFYKPDEPKDRLDNLLEELSSAVYAKREKVRNDLLTAEKLYITSTVDKKLNAVYLLTKNYNGQIFTQINNMQKIPLLIGSPNIEEDISLLHDKLLSGNKIQGVINVLKKKIPYFEDLRKSDDTLVVLLSNATEPLPLSFMGDGFKALLKLEFLAPLVKNGIVLFEEPEISMHPGYLDILADEILSNSENSQFFVSTHSLEFIGYLLEKADRKNKTDNINIIRLHRLNNGEIERQILNGRESKQKMDEIQMDLRGY